MKRKFNPVREYIEDGIFESSAYDISKIPYLSSDDLVIIEAEIGYPFMVVGFDLPFCIYLEDGLYPIKLNNELYIIKLIKKERENVLYINAKAKNLEMKNDPRGIFRYSHCELSIKNNYPNSFEIHSSSEILNIIFSMINLIDIETLRKLIIESISRIRQREWTSDEINSISTRSLNSLLQQLKQILDNLELNDLKSFYFELRLIILYKQILKALNRFLDVYREVTEHYYIPSLRRTDIIGFSLCQFISTSEYKNMYNLRFGNPVRRFIIDSTVEEHEIIWEMLEKDTPIEVYKQMLHNSQRYFLEDNYQFSLIEAFSAFELFIDKLLHEKLLSQGLSKEDIKNILNIDRNWQITIRVRELINNFFGVKITEDISYQRWIDAKKLRDDIIHNGKRDIPEEELIEAIHNINRYIKYIKKILE